MRILLDECVNPRLRAAWPDQKVESVFSMGWQGITNGKLMALAQLEFDVFVTVDKNLEFQQNLEKLQIGIIVVSVPDNNIKHFRPLFQRLYEVAVQILPGQVIRVSGEPDL